MDVDVYQLDANKAILLSKADNNPSENENVEKLAIKFGGIDLKENFDTAYIKAIRTKDFSFIEDLLMNYNGGLRFIKSTTVKDWNDVLSDAASQGHEGVLRLLLERDENGQYVHKDINPGAYYNVAILLAANQGHEGVLRFLLERDENGQYVHKDINPGAKDNLAIRMAAARGHEGVLRFLLERDENGQYVHKTVDPGALNY